MARPAGTERRAFVAQLLQKLAEPAQTILGYQELVIEEARENGPAEALPDLEKVRDAARSLASLIERLVAGGGPAEGEGPALEARLRHDLRTPMSAVLGYSEMVFEEFQERLSARLAEDLGRVVHEARRLLDQIDAVVDLARSSPAADAPEADEHTIAADLVRSLAAGAVVPEPRSGRILVVDDMESNRELLSRRLTRMGHDVATAASGGAALEILAEGPFDLALLDILMPDMNGLELLRLIKADETLRDMPVLMVSGLHDDDAIVGCIAAGAEDYLPKPVDPVLLRARIDACLERGRWRERERRYLARIEFEKERADALLEAVLPGQVVRRLAGGETVIADRFEAVSIIFADIVNFSPYAASTSPTALVRRLGALFSRFDDIADRHGVEKIKTIGDAYMAISGAPEPRRDHAQAAVAFARALLLEARGAETADHPLDLRIGVHSGPVIAGLIGRKRFVYDVWGHTVNVASRLETYGSPGRIQISQTTLEALGGTTAAAPQGELVLKGIGPVVTFLLD